MKPLLADDPEAVGGYRLLARLGAGGMGVVYLARSAGGTPVALKVIRSAHAEQPGFRPRFRREARLAAALRGRWLVPVLAADAEAPDPWLVTPFVPGPSLAEALTAHGAFPPSGVRVLGGRLAEALAEVHAAGLVHRDVKPGNVLLALDGPRLIDFGIARPAGASALTATGVVVGTPGYLSPEQAQGRGPQIGPPSDVFALGCVLAHAATGRRPFGGGAVAAVLYRTVHDEPELTGVPEPLLPLLRRCLAREPAARPTAEEVRAALDGPEPPGGWLPPAVPGLIAERSARALRFPADGPVRRTPPPGDAPAPGPAPAPAAGRPGRRRVLAALAGTAGAAAVGGAAWAFTRRGGGNGATPAAPLPRRVLGFHADLTGPAAAQGRAQERGARLAVAELNGRADRPFDLALEVFDDGGDPGRAAEAPARLGEDAGALAVLGPTTVDAALAALPGYQERMLPTATVSVLTEEGPGSEYGVWFPLRPLGSGAVTLPAIAYFTHATGSSRTLVIEDRAAGPAARSLARSLAAVPPSEGTVLRHAVPGEAADFAPVAEAAVAERADALFLVADDAERAAGCARALRRAGYRGPRMGLESALADGAFAGAAGDDAEGWVYSTGYTDPAADPACRDFAAAYRERHGSAAVPAQAAEAYDAVHFLAAGLAALGARATADREGRNTLRLRLWRTSHEGVSRTIAFQRSTRTFELNGTGLFLYRIEDGAGRLLGAYRDADASWHTP